MRAVALDAMGVLYCSADDVADLLIPFVRARGAALTEEEIRSIYRRAYLGELTSHELWQHLGIEGDAGELDATYVGGHEVTPGMTDLIDELCREGLLVGCISNDIAEWSRALRRRHALDERIACWTISGEVHARKPDERIYRAFLDDARLTADRVVFVDDRPANVQAAAALGFATILVDFLGTGQVPDAIQSVDALRVALMAWAHADPDHRHGEQRLI